MEAQEQAEWMVNKHGDSAMKEHEKIMKDIRAIYGGDTERAINESQSYVHLIVVKNNILEMVGCQCDNPKIHTDKHGINYCKKCKVETELIKPKKR